MGLKTTHTFPTPLGAVQTTRSKGGTVATGGSGLLGMLGLLVEAKAIHDAVQKQAKSALRKKEESAQRKKNANQNATSANRKKDIAPDRWVATFIPYHLEYPNSHSPSRPKPLPQKVKSQLTVQTLKGFVKDYPGFESASYDQSKGELNAIFKGHNPALRVSNGPVNTLRDLYGNSTQKDYERWVGNAAANTWLGGDPPEVTVNKKKYTVAISLKNVTKHNPVSAQQKKVVAKVSKR